MYPLDEPELLYEGLKDVQAVKTSSELAEVARKTASCLLASCSRPNYTEKFTIFATKLVANLRTCFVNQQTGKQEMEAMWGSYHQLRSSSTFRELWGTFVQESIGRAPTPTFYQHITHNIFKVLVKRRFQLVESESTDTSGPMTHIEENTLRYVAGYVCRKVNTKLAASKHPNKDDMILSIHELSGDEENERGTEDWTNILDRGGLWHISDTAYSLFYAIEDEVRCHLLPSLAPTMNEGTKAAIVSAVMRSEDVSFEWSLFGAGIDNEIEKELLEMIVSLYVTTRGFSLATSCIENFKKENKKMLQKGKGLRKEIFTSSIS